MSKHFMFSCMLLMLYGSTSPMSPGTSAGATRLLASANSVRMNPQPTMNFVTAPQAQVSQKRLQEIIGHNDNGSSTLPSWYSGQTYFQQIPVTSGLSNINTMDMASTKKPRSNLKETSTNGSQQGMLTGTLFKRTRPLLQQRNRRQENLYQASPQHVMLASAGIGALYLAEKLYYDTYYPGYQEFLIPTLNPDTNNRSSTDTTALNASQKLHSTTEEREIDAAAWEAIQSLKNSILPLSKEKKEQAVWNYINSTLRNQAVYTDSESTPSYPYANVSQKTHDIVRIKKNSRGVGKTLHWDGQYKVMIAPKKRNK